ncbi:MAG: DUF447 domain-containing protein [Candidatus Altiarchaeota archaeon]
MDSKLKENWVYEVVVESGGGHAAPMGVKFTGDGNVVLDAYNSSETCKNIGHDGSYRIYFTDVLGLKEALDKKRLSEKILPSMEVKVEDKEDLGDFTRFTGKITYQDNTDEIRPVNRAEALLLEALIESTKPQPVKEKIREYARVISKVAPDSEYDKNCRKL